MVRRTFDVEIPDGQHLGFSRGTDGAYRAHLFDDETNELTGHAELFETDEAFTQDAQYADAPHSAALTDEELAEALEALARLVLIVATLASAAAPHVRSWWQDIALPAMRSAKNGAVTAVRSRWDRVTAARRTGPPAVEIITPAEPAGGARSTELAVAFQEYQARMSSAEARERFVRALLARAFSEEQLRLLRNARVDDDRPSALATAVAALTPAQVEDTLTVMLEKNPSLLGCESLHQLGMVLGRRADGDLVPLRVECRRAEPHRADPPPADRPAP